MLTVTKVARENIAATPNSGKAHAGTALDSFFVFTVSRARNASLASYFRPTTAGAHGSDGVVLGDGVVVTVVTIAVQQVALLHSPCLQRMCSLFSANPSGHVKLPQVGTGVVVTVVQGDSFTAQHVALSQVGAV